MISRNVWCIGSRRIGSKSHVSWKFSRRPPPPTRSNVFRVLRPGSCLACRPGARHSPAARVHRPHRGHDATAADHIILSSPCTYDDDDDDDDDDNNNNIRVRLCWRTRSVRFACVRIAYAYIQSDAETGVETIFPRVFYTLPHPRGRIARPPPDRRPTPTWH